MLEVVDLVFCRRPPSRSSISPTQIRLRTYAPFENIMVTSVCGRAYLGGWLWQEAVIAIALWLPSARPRLSSAIGSSSAGSLLGVLPLASRASR